MTKVLEGRFKVYHEENPHIYDLFQRFAGEALGRGYKNYSANAIFERIRWYVNVETVGDQFKINNSYRPYYARKLMEDDPNFKDFFRIRKLQD